MPICSDDSDHNDIFFDSLDGFKSSLLQDQEELSSSNGRNSSSKSGYEIWINEPATSVEERRHNFLQQMGLAEFATTKMINNTSVSDSDTQKGLDNLDTLKEENNGAVEETAALEYSYAREEGGEANLMSGQFNHLFQNNEQNAVLAQQTAASSHTEERRNLRHLTTKMSSSWWKRFVNRGKKTGSRVASEESKPKGGRANKIKVLQKKKRCLELTAPYVGQVIYAHKGFISTIKFSPEGQYLASGGKDGVVRVWRVRAVDANSSDYLTAEEHYSCGKLNERKFTSFQRKHPIHASVIFPDKIFRIEESPIQEFHGHSSDILDLAWSNSNCILSSSKDKTVRLWKLGCDDSLNVFRHNDYVTCIHFNPVDDNCFISGSVDGKVRIWGLSEKRVVDWTDVRDVITAICYQPDGKGFLVGSITGTCRSYKVSGEGPVLDAQTNIRGRKKTAGNKITGIKFSQENSQRVMISSEDSKLRIFDGVDLSLIYKYKGLPKSGSQISASFTSTERRIVSLGEDSHVYIWNHDASSVRSSKETKSISSCEHFFYEGISVAIPWSGMETERERLSNASSIRAQEHREAASWPRESERFPLSSWFSMDSACRESATWPEEKLPLWEVPTTKDQDHKYKTAISETWGLVIVAAGLDGTIRTFHNYGLPVRL